MSDNGAGSGNGRKRGGRNNNQKGGKRKARSRSRAKKVDPVKYWGDRELLRIPETVTLDTPDTSVVATSLGRPPIPGQENASKHYFSLVYDRAAALAGALAAAGDLENMAANAEAFLDQRDDDDQDDPDEDADDDAEGVEIDGNRIDDTEAPEG